MGVLSTDLRSHMEEVSSRVKGLILISPRKCMCVCVSEGKYALLQGGRDLLVPRRSRRVWTAEPETKINTDSDAVVTAGDRMEHALQVWGRCT